MSAHVHSRSPPDRCAPYGQEVKCKNKNISKYSPTTKANTRNHLDKQKALELLRSRSTKTSKVAKVKKNIDEVKNKIAGHCSSIKHSNIYNKPRRKVPASGFSRSYVALQMKKCLMQHKWTYITKIFPLLLNQRIDIEPLVWKYMLIQLLYSPKANVETLNNFLHMCVGCQSLEFLQQVLTLTATPNDAGSTDLE